MNHNKRDDSTPAFPVLSIFRGLYQRVAAKLGVDPSYVSRVARGERKSAAVLAALQEEVDSIRQELNRLDGLLADGKAKDGDLRNGRLLDGKTPNGAAADAMASRARSTSATERDGQRSSGNAGNGKSAKKAPRSSTSGDEKAAD